MDMQTTPVRRLSRLGVAFGTLSVMMVAAPAAASPPETWPAPEDDSLLQTLAFLVGLPLLIIALITLAVYLPSMMRGQSTEPALAFHDRNEWFGGPRKGLGPDGPAPEEHDTTKGGASAQW